MSTRRATISDVARAAGVAASTASVVFSGKTPVSDATRQRVLDAAAELDYTGPDPRAASLRRGRSGIVGVVFEGALRTVFLDPVTRIMMDGVADGVASLGAGLLLLRDDDREPTLVSAPLDAAVLVGCNAGLRESMAILRSRGIPVVVIEGDAGPDVPQIDLDNRDAQREMAQHVRTLGHERVVAVTLPCDASRRRGWIPVDQQFTVDVTRDRLAGFRDVFPDAGALAAAGSSIDEGLIAGRVLFADPAGRPTAVIAQSDMLAAGVIRAAEEAGLRVAHDVTVTGFDGVSVDGLAPYELTTMAQPAADKGRAAGQAVAAMLEGRDAASFRFTCTFRAGNTAAAPSA
ncbi:LacI family transcriptional regulator [Microbacterium protaetiae]|uniref:LacI family transcriptional regulator n=1 Tax=Microbacterium protaetiae TaxID=2509458 RepID=A0A4P6EP75_9MICO|nr:substrate-binding domain-containing protein [Microbacterium protaetiae]QAY59748.1 LacI family transcriptional regulator [Microbacterium protaetiae]